MTLAIVAGGIMGIGLFLFSWAMIPRRVSLARQIAAFDAGRKAPAAQAARGAGEKESALSLRAGSLVARFCAEQGWEFPSVRANLSLTGKSFESYLAGKILLALFGRALIARRIGRGQQGELASHLSLPRVEVAHFVDSGER